MVPKYCPKNSFGDVCSRYGKVILRFLLLFGVLSAQAIEDNHLPLTHVAFRTGAKLKLDGKLDEPGWLAAPWTENFVDIEGYHMPKSLYQTRAKILWNDEYLYIGAELEEPHIWATYTEHESVIFHEKNFEIFIDPNADKHNYDELEINALGTKWDLLLTKPYKNGGTPRNAWEILGLDYGIHLAGTLKNPNDSDTLWSIEIAMPWKVITEAARPRRAPEPGEQWRINFSRVEWQIEPFEGGYRKIVNPGTGRPYPEYNWVWSPQGLIDLHYPERWGYVQFSSNESGKGSEEFVTVADESVKRAMRKLNDQQYNYFREYGRFATLKHFSENQMAIFQHYKPVGEITDSQFKIFIKSPYSGIGWVIANDSKVWQTE